MRVKSDRSASILVVGSINLDIVVRVHALPARGETVAGHDAELMLGGKGANQAVAAHRLCRQPMAGKVKFLSCLGDDAFGAVAQKSLIDFGLDLTNIKTVSGVATGIAMITVDRHGQNIITLSSGANNYLHKPDVDALTSIISAGDILLLQNEISADVSKHAAHEMKSKGGFIIIDPAPAQNFAPALIPLADILTPNETEVAALTGRQISGQADAIEAARSLVKAGAGAVIIKMGAAGVVFAGKYGEGHIAAPQVFAVDTVAAGDCFNGALAVAISEGQDFRAALEFACAAAAISVTRKGAALSMPNRDDIDNLVLKR
jgi:ribokinase